MRKPRPRAGIGCMHHRPVQTGSPCVSLWAAIASRADLPLGATGWKFGVETGLGCRKPAVGSVVHACWVEDNKGFGYTMVEPAAGRPEVCRPEVWSGFVDASTCMCSAADGRRRHPRDLDGTRRAVARPWHRSGSAGCIRDRLPLSTQSAVLEGHAATVSAAGQMWSLGPWKRTRLICGARVLTCTLDRARGEKFARAMAAHAAAPL